MPLQVQIPIAATKGLAALMRLSQNVADQLCTMLDKIPPRLRTRDIPKRLVGKIDISAAALRDIVRILISLYSAREQEEATVDEFVDAICNAIEQSDAEELKDIKGSVSEFKPRFKAFLSLDRSLGVTAKALSVAYENPRHYHSARILTDARPVFAINAAEEPKAFVIIHTLRFNIHEEGNYKEWFVALNSLDLENLKRVINRAIKKEKSLTEIMKKTKATLLEWEE